MNTTDSKAIHVHIVVLLKAIHSPTRVGIGTPALVYCTNEQYVVLNVRVSVTFLLYQHAIYVFYYTKCANSLRSKAGMNRSVPVTRMIFVSTTDPNKSGVETALQQPKGICMGWSTQRSVPLFVWPQASIHEHLVLYRLAFQGSNKPMPFEGRPKPRTGGWTDGRTDKKQISDVCT